MAYGSVWTRTPRKRRTSSRTQKRTPSRPTARRMFPRSPARRRAVKRTSRSRTGAYQSRKRHMAVGTSTYSIPRNIVTKHKNPRATKVGADFVYQNTLEKEVMITIGDTTTKPFIIDLNPLQGGLGVWVASMVQGFESYRVNSMRIECLPNSGNTNMSGEVVMAQFTDAATPIGDMTYRISRDQPGAVQGPVHQNLVLNVKCPRKKYKTHVTGTAAGRRQESCGKVAVYVQNFGLPVQLTDAFATGSEFSIARIMVHFDITAFQPSLLNIGNADFRVAVGKNILGREDPLGVPRAFNLQGSIIPMAGASEPVTEVPKMQLLNHFEFHNVDGGTNDQGAFQLCYSIRSTASFDTGAETARIQVLWQLPPSFVIPSAYQCESLADAQTRIDDNEEPVQKVPEDGDPVKASFIFNNTLSAASSAALINIELAPDTAIGAGETLIVFYISGNYGVVGGGATDWTDPKWLNGRTDVTLPNLTDVVSEYAPAVLELMAPMVTWLFDTNVTARELAQVVVPLLPDEFEMKDGHYWATQSTGDTIDTNTPLGEEFDCLGFLFGRETPVGACIWELIKFAAPILGGLLLPARFGVNEKHGFTFKYPGTYEIRIVRRHISAAFFLDEAIMLQADYENAHADDVGGWILFSNHNRKDLAPGLPALQPYSMETVIIVHAARAGDGFSLFHSGVPGAGALDDIKVTFDIQKSTMTYGDAITQLQVHS